MRDEKRENGEGVDKEEGEEAEEGELSYCYFFSVIISTLTVPLAVGDGKANRNLHG